MVQGIEYERIADAEWEMHRLEIEELESYVSRLLEVQHSIYDVVEFESKVEYDFAKALDARKDIKLFFKLPDWFKVETASRHLQSRLGHCARGAGRPEQGVFGP